jgi:succinate dehydrogenase/fumarate reductase flavoprotein subunit
MTVNERVIECDVLVIGGGLAGSFAAIEAKENNELDVVLVDKGYVSMSGGSSFAGGFSALYNPKWGHDKRSWKETALEIGEYLNDQEWLDIHLANSWARYQQLDEWGAPFHRDENGDIKEFNATPPLTHVRLRSQKFMPVIRKKALETGVKILDRIMMTELIKQDGRIVGAVGFHTRDGDFFIFKAKATIVATGQGTFKAPGYPHDYWTADGESMCYRAGLGLVNREFGHQIEFIYREMPALFTVHGLPGPKMINAEGDEFEKFYYSEILSPARLHKAEMFEAHEGRSPLYIDLRHITDAQRRTIKELESIINRIAIRRRFGQDISIDKHEILWGGAVGATGPAAGGVVINTKCETELPGLYAAGDTAGTNMSGGAYVNVGFGLTTACISGHIAGENAAAFCKQAEKTDIDRSAVAELKAVTYAPLNRKGGFRASWVTQMLQNTMVPYYVAGIKRADRLEATITMIKFMREHLVPLQRAADPHELRMANEARNMALNAEMILRSSLFRTESRGMHYREDYPCRDDENWLAWSVLKDVDGEMKLSKKPLPDAWRPDLSKPYRERYPFKFPGEGDKCQ